MVKIGFQTSVKRGVQFSFSKFNNWANNIDHTSFQSYIQ
jgi:hypothetical protein